MWPDSLSWLLWGLLWSSLLLQWHAVLEIEFEDTAMNDSAPALVMLFVFGSIIGIVVLAIRQHNAQAARQYLCLDCETVSSNHFARRPSWPWFIVGPFALLWPKKMTCKTCKSHELIPADSPKAQKILSAASAAK